MKKQVVTPPFAGIILIRFYGYFSATSFMEAPRELAYKKISRAKIYSKKIV